MKCTICHKSIVLVPSAEERARVHGGTPDSYRRLFTEHSNCTLQKRRADTSELMQRGSK